jgi:hypothetical protein
MKQLIGHDVAMADVKKTYVAEFSKVFGVALEQKELEDLLKIESAA